MLLKTITKTFDYLALSTTFFLLMVVAINILARQLHELSAGSINLMIPGAIELSKYALLLIIFTALPRATTSNMVRVNLLSDKLPEKIQRTFNSLWLIFMALFSAILTWLFTQKTILTFSRGDASQDLQMPLFYFYALISLACFFTVLSCLIKAFANENKDS